MNTLCRIKTIAQYSFYEGWRGHIFLAVTLIVLVSALLAEFIGSLVLTDTWQTKISVYAFIIRIAVLIVIALYIINALIRDRLDKQTEWLLSIDSPRQAYLYARIAGFLLIGLLIAVICVIYPLLYAPVENSLIWIASFAAEMLIIVMLSVFFSLSFNSSFTAFVAIGAFYILARNIGNIILLTQSPILQKENETLDITRLIIQSIHYVIPDLWKYADTSWLIYGDGNLEALSNNLIEALIFSFLVLLAAVIDLYRKNI